ncbi:GNAT family N-acetyltransferase [Litoreibacter janthinus]|uniref:Phosphinothricin acetyltransferase n=1 Tax=Litoreibacter janthinus TaxID=670154 RepID=A0A1I6GMA4_9RHOB|nr:GNAT family N-acetyltransferase [Litoreibacter janthinus]SFR43345.1 phosphinothricin acetyltransferase [Litoreibacter janthinus]
MIRIRAAQPADAEGILAILNPIISETTITFSPTLATSADVKSGLREHAQRGDPYLVAEKEGAVLGIAKYGPFRSGEGYAKSVEITVHLAPDARGKGIGRLLVENLETHARNAGKHSLIAGVSAENHEAEAFHTKLGFTRVGLIPQVGHKFGRYIDLLLMQKFV